MANLRRHGLGCRQWRISFPLAIYPPLPFPMGIYILLYCQHSVCISFQLVVMLIPLCPTYTHLVSKCIDHTFRLCIIPILTNIVLTIMPSFIHKHLLNFSIYIHKHCGLSSLITEVFQQSFSFLFIFFFIDHFKIAKDWRFPDRPAIAVSPSWRHLRIWGWLYLSQYEQSIARQRSLEVVDILDYYRLLAPIPEVQLPNYSPIASPSNTTHKLTPASTMSEDS